MGEYKKILEDVPYWIIDGYYFQPDYENIDRSIILKNHGEKLVNVTDEEHTEILNKIKSMIKEANSKVNIP